MRPIDADDFKKFIESLTEVGAPYAEIIKLLDQQPTVERPKGKWIYKMQVMTNPYCYKCSNCGLLAVGKHNFCPNCGAEMEE